MKQILHGLLIVAAIVCQQSCALVSSPVVSSVAPGFESRTPRKIAVLPVANNTLYTDGPPMLRTRLHDELGSRGYEIMPADSVDAVLKEKFGIVSGSQLDGVEPADLASALGADGIFYTALTEWSRTRVLERDHISVGAEFQLRSGSGRDVLWQARHEVFRQVVAKSFFSNQEAKDDRPLYMALVRELLVDVLVTLPPPVPLNPPMPDSGTAP